MQNTNNNTDRAAIAARLDAVTADFCQLHLDARGHLMSHRERAVLDILQDEMQELRRQLKDADVPATPAPEPAPEETENPDAYNGWANYETWSVHLWLSNDPNSDESARGIVANAWTNAADEVADDPTAIVAPRADAADALQDWLRDEENPLSEHANLYSDLLGAAFDRVNWFELADAFAPDPLPSIEPTTDDDEYDDAGEEEAGA